MSNYQNIQEKLEAFIRKYYVNELIKGCFLFFTIGLLYFIFTLFVEYMLWLNPLARTLLFWCFILVELSLLGFYIVLPIFKISGINRGLSSFEASKIIGSHFPEISDKLLNMLQLKKLNQNSELIEASIEQKSNELIPIPFIKAVDFSKNKKYVKYALIPIAFALLIYVTNSVSFFNESFKRVVHHTEQFEQPAPFTFTILNESLDVVEGEPFVLQIETVGSVIPEDAKIFFEDENYYLVNNGDGKFEFQFGSIKKSLEFNLEANGFSSKFYQINAIATPVISSLIMVMQYPIYTGKQNEVIQSSGNAIVPEGTKITWQIDALKTDKISFVNEVEAEEYFSHRTKSLFSFSKVINNSLNYKIATSNKNFKNHESLNFGIQVVSDDFPKIIVRSNIDSISRGPVQFIGQVSDDFGVSKLQLNYYNKENPSKVFTKSLAVLKSTFSDFFYIFPDGLQIEEGINYEFYFEVFDNDGVNGSKRTKSSVFNYYNKNASEISEELLKEQKENLNAISKDLTKNKQSNKELDKFNKELQKKAEMNWNDSKKIEELIKRQTQYENLLNERTKKLDENLKDQPSSETMKDKKEELQKRIEETKKLNEDKKLLDELKELSEKLEKEDLVEKLKEMSGRNKQREQSLERILELTKRFYVEQKQQQIKDKIKKLSEKEDVLSNESDEKNTAKKQEELNKEFDDVLKELNDLKKENNELKRPMKLPDTSEEKIEIDNEMDKALDELKNNKKENAKKTQKDVAKKMRKMSSSMEKSMAESEGESIDEDIDDLRKIVENLIEFSFQQETLMDKFSKAANGHPEFSKNLKKQQVLKEYFEHIDDSLYVLSLRMVKLGTEIQKEVSDVHFNMDEALSNFSDNNSDQGVSNQHFVITGANNLANSLSNVLESLMNSSPSMGKGKGDKGFSLPDIIKKQGELSDEVKEGMKKDEKGEKGKEGENKKGEGNSEGMNEELYEIYKQQLELRGALEKLLGKEKGGSGNSGKEEALKKMEELENELLKKGFTNEIIQRMQQLNYELLKLEKAKKEQGIDDQRKSNTTNLEFNNRVIDTLKLENRYFNNLEILNRQSLPLRIIYKKKVQDYFKAE